MVFPAAGFILAALSLLEQAEQPLKLGLMKLDQPLKLPAPDAAAWLQGHWHTDQLTFYSRPDAAGSSPWQRHGEVFLAGDLPVAPPFALSPAPDSVQQVELDRFYEALAQVGLE